jgi:hypothetical protein
MRALLVVMVCATVLTGGAAAKQQPANDAGSSPASSSWRQLVTPDFIVTGNAPTGELKRTLVELMRFRDTLARCSRPP